MTMLNAEAIANANVNTNANLNITMNANANANVKDNKKLNANARVNATEAKCELAILTLRKERWRKAWCCPRPLTVAGDGSLWRLPSCVTW